MSLAHQTHHPISQPLPTYCDILIVGAGAVGLGTAMALSQTGHHVVVIEAEREVARHQTGHNSGVIHSGLYYKPGSLKAKLCVEGRIALYEFCRQKNIPHEQCGKVVVACDNTEKSKLDELVRRGAANGLEGLKILDMVQIHDREPSAAGVAGIVVREEGIVNYASVTRSYAEVVREQGGSVVTSAQLKRVEVRQQSVVAKTSIGEIEAGVLVNCAGLHCDRVARLCGLVPEIKIVPFRGEYYELVPQARHLVKHLIYPVPDPRFPFLGVHFTRTIDGMIEAGPNAVLALARHGYAWKNISARDMFETLGFSGFWRMSSRYWKPGLGEMIRSIHKPAFVKALRRLMPMLESHQIKPAGAGVRAQALTREGTLADDFVIQRTRRMVHVLNAPSPAATASIAIGKYVADQVREIAA